MQIIAHLSEQPGLFGCSPIMSHSIDTGYTRWRVRKRRGDLIDFQNCSDGSELPGRSVVEMKGFEPSTSALRTLRSPN